MNKKKQTVEPLEPLEPISFKKNVGDNYYTITAINDDGKEIKFQALIFDAKKVERDIERSASAK